MLANITKVEEKIQYVRSQKEKIFEDKQKDYIHAKSQALSNYQKALLDAVEKKIQELQEADIDELKKKQKELQKSKKTGEMNLNKTFSELVSELCMDMKNRLSSGVKVLFREASQGVASAEGTSTEYETVNDGVGAKIVNFFTFGLLCKEETTSYSVTTVRTGDIRNTLRDLTSEIESEIENVAYEKVSTWKKKMQSTLVSSLREVVDDEYLDDFMIKSMFHTLANTIVYPDISFEDNSLNSTLRQSGTLKEDEAEEYMEAARDYISTFKASVTKKTKQYTEQLKNTLSKYEIGTEIFANIDETITAFEDNIKNKKAVLAQYDTIKKDLTVV